MKLTMVGFWFADLRMLKKHLTCRRAHSPSRHQLVPTISRKLECHSRSEDAF